MNKTNKTTKTVCRTLVAMLLLVLPAGDVYAQLFGGTIKPKKNVVISIPANITIAQNRRHFIVSVYDQDYTPYTVPTDYATTSTIAADGVNESVTINIQGSLSTSGKSISIPVTATGSGTLPAYYASTIIPATYTEDGVNCEISLSWPGTAYTSSTVSIVATLKAVSTTLNAKKLDVNAGLGSDFLGVLIGSISYPYNHAGSLASFQIRDIAPIPDRMFGLADNTGQIEHNFLYVPVIAEDGKIWLNNNLGADYCNLDKTSVFNPLQQGNSAYDYLAYGSLFQWGRSPDGHEITQWPNSGLGIIVNGTTNILADLPSNGKFITNSKTPYNWRINVSTTLWSDGNAVNNPCPSGFRVPTTIEGQNWVDIIGPSNYKYATLLDFLFRWKSKPIW